MIISNYRGRTFYLAPGPLYRTWNSRPCMTAKNKMANSLPWDFQWKDSWIHFVHVFCLIVLNRSTSPKKRSKKGLAAALVKALFWDTFLPFWVWFACFLFWLGRASSEICCVVHKNNKKENWRTCNTISSFFSMNIWLDIIGRVQSQMSKNKACSDPLLNVQQLESRVWCGFLAMGKASIVWAGKKYCTSTFFPSPAVKIYGLWALFNEEEK